MQSNYESYSAAEFLEDEFFIRWIRDRKPEDEAFWKEWVSANPANLESMQAAKDRLKIIFTLNRIEPQNDDANEVWSKIAGSIQVTGKVVPMNAGRRLRLVAAAAVVLIMISVASYYFFNSVKERQVAERPVKGLKNDIAAGGNRAILTLSDGSQIVLDSAGAGTITQQGNTKIIKLGNGQLSYNRESSVSNGQPEVLYNTISTPRGGQYQIELPDGSQVWLNAESSLHFPTAFNGKERSVELAGEAYFEVAKNASMPFTVKTKAELVQVLGTHFNVMAYEEENSQKTTLLEGSVKVIRDQAMTLLKPGEQAKTDKGDANIRVFKADVDHEVAWKNGLFDFDNDNIRDIMNQLARWYDVQVVYAGPAPKNHYTGSIRREVNASQVLHMLELAGGIQFSIEGKRIVVKEK